MSDKTSTADQAPLAKPVEAASCTPRSDAVADASPSGLGLIQYNFTWYCFARQLERENADLLAACEGALSYMQLSAPLPSDVAPSVYCALEARLADAIKKARGQ